MVITPSPAMIGDNVSKRGAFILLEGIDRCGKTTQCSLLVKHLLSLSIAALALRFPDRTTTVGKVIDQYLKSSPTVDGKKGAVDDRAIHLLFSANRWEAVPSILETLGNGVNIVCDRYAYSGVAFSSAKTREDMDVATASAVRAMGRLGDDMEGLDLEWCMA
jgi:dTMP kinase